MKLVISTITLKKYDYKISLNVSKILFLIKDSSTKWKCRTMEVLSCRSWPESTGYFHLNKICSLYKYRKLFSMKLPCHAEVIKQSQFHEK